MVAYLGLAIHSILLGDMRFSSLVSNYCGSSIPVVSVSHQSGTDISVTRNALSECSVVALESLPDHDSVLSNLGRSWKTSLVTA